MLLLCSVSATAQTSGTQPDSRSSDSGKSQSDTTVNDTINREPRDALGRPISGDGPLRLIDVIRYDSAMIFALLDSLRNTPEARMRRALAFDAQDWQPTEADRVRRQQEIWQSIGWDKLFGNSIRIPILSIPISSIGRTLGLTEDVSPRIRYTLLRTENVSVKIYDLESHEVASIVDGSQRPGVYDFNWNMLDRSGRRVLFGSYIAEVIVGDRLILSKRIEVP